MGRPVTGKGKGKTTQRPVTGQPAQYALPQINFHFSKQFKKSEID